MELQTNEDIVSSPKLTSFLTNREQFQPGELVNLEIELDPETLEFFPGVYNVSRLHVFRNANAERSTQLEKIVTLDAQDAQESFYYEWTATESGTASDEIFAFVETNAFDNYFYGNFELGKPKASSSNLFLLVSDDYSHRIVEISPDFSKIIDIKATEGTNKYGFAKGITNFSIFNGDIAYVFKDSEIDFTKLVIGEKMIIAGENNDFWYVGTNNTVAGVLNMNPLGSYLDIYDHDGNFLRSVDYNCGGRLQKHNVGNHPVMTETHFAFVGLDPTYADWGLAFASLEDGSCEWIHPTPQTHGNKYRIVGESLFYGDLAIDNKIVQMDFEGNIENRYAVIDSGYIRDFLVIPGKSIVVFRDFEGDSLVDIYEWDGIIPSYSETINFSRKFNLGKVLRAEIDN